MNRNYRIITTVALAAVFCFFVIAWASNRGNCRACKEQGEEISWEWLSARFNKKRTVSNTVHDTPLPRSPVKYNRINETINGNLQVIHTLEIVMQDHRVQVMPALAHDSIFGFEKTSEMARRNHAYAAVNGGFYYDYGEPSGITIKNGKVISTSSSATKRPLFVIDKMKRAYITEIDIDVSLMVGGKAIKIDGINRKPIGDEIILYTNEYGRTTRIDGQLSFNLTISQGVLTELYASESATRIPPESIVITALGDRMEMINNLESLKGEKCDIIYKDANTIDTIEHAFEGGFWIVRNGKKVVKEIEEWVGFTTNREPRTVAGITTNNTILFMTVDGRQPGYSVGLTGDELAEYVIDKGIKDAMMLDGGASSTMVLEGNVVNKPSYRGRERSVGGAVIIKIDK